MGRFCPLLLALSLTWGGWALPARAQNRFLPGGSSGVALSVLRNIDEYDPHWGLAGGASWRGRVALVAEYRRDGWLGRDGTSVGLEVAPLRAPHLILEAGLLRTWRPGYRLEPNLLPLRLTFPLLGMEGFRILPQITGTWVRGWGDTFLKGDAGCDFVISRRWLLGAELNLNQDWRYHQWTFRAGAVLP